MAHSCRWRFPARPGGSSNSGTGRRGAAGRVRVTASLRGSPETRQPAGLGLGPGFDAALQVSAAIGSNLRKFRDVLGESSDTVSSGEDSVWIGAGSFVSAFILALTKCGRLKEHRQGYQREEPFFGFGTVTEHKRIQSPTRTSAGALIPEKKPRGRPPRSLTAQKATASLSSPSSPGSPAQGKPDQAHERSADKVKRLPGRPPGSGSGEKRRGRPPSSSSQRTWHAASHAAGEDGRLARPELAMEMQEEKDRKSSAKRALLGSAHQQDTETKLPKVARDESKVTKLKRLREVKLSPLKSRLKALPGVPRRRRGRPPSAERLKAEAAAAARLSGSASHPGAFRRATDQHALQQAVDDSEQQDSSPPPSKLGRPLGLRQSPRHIKPVRIVPSSKRTDATIAKQLLQRAKKGAQKKKLLEKDAVAIGGPGSGGMEAGIRRRRRTQLKNIRQFIMPVVSTVSLRIIKTPKRFIEDEGSFGTPPHHMKMARLETPPTSVSTPPQLTSISSSPSPVLVSSTAAAAAASTGTTAPVDSLPPPPPPASDPSIVSPAAGLLNNSTNSTANGRFSSSAASCGSSALSQHSSQLSSAESSRSSSPSLDDSSCDSQASEATQALSETDEPFPSSQCEMEATLLHSSRPPSPSSEREHVVVERDRGSCKPGLGSRGRGTLTTGAKKPIISPATGVLMSSSTLGGSQQASSAGLFLFLSPTPSPPQSPAAPSVGLLHNIRHR
ncbi:Histone-lysine N-methyltransferase 2A [Merluccius polli]|uniref:Histone-lysine N-methyltransferase 2A n=1 Tax=Merluccius polli TaxID=89951 RepID=A0AA47N1D6_MERPO|nr:Histone-lysine N-methyltransferase 2A [Merluccius polli]